VAKANPRTAYARGAAFEREVKAALEAAGYTVQRSPKSGGVYDLLAVRDVARGEVLFIQCKKAGDLRPEGWNALYTLATTHGALPILVAREARKPMRFYRLVGHKMTLTRRQPWVMWEVSSGNKEGRNGTDR
jgi:Holliday junction resolvase